VFESNIRKKHLRHKTELCGGWSVTWEDNIKMDRKEIGWGSGGWIELDQEGTSGELL
jgi:hypothetical protein